ncbi:hypothetical protein GCM10028775_72830 [Catellatospora paridis]
MLRSVPLLTGKTTPDDAIVPLLHLAAAGAGRVERGHYRLSGAVGNDSRRKDRRGVSP